MEYLTIFGLLLVLACNSAQGISVVTNCPGTVDEDNGRITSPNYPRNYGNNERCYWSLSSQIGEMTLRFEAFDTERRYDFVRVTDFDTKVTLSLHGRPDTNDLAVNISSNHINVTFTSDGSSTRTGFSLIYQLDICGNYSELNDENRSIYVKQRSRRCEDRSLKKDWYRFTGNAGTQMATRCAPYYYCGVYRAGWLYGSHPTSKQEIVSRTVYFGCDYNYKTPIRVAKCNDFYIYELVPTWRCETGYCGNGNNSTCTNNQPCYNGGACHASWYSWYCSCPHGSYGSNCQSFYNMTATTPYTWPNESATTTPYPWQNASTTTVYPWQNNTGNSTEEIGMCSNYQELSSANRSRYHNNARTTCDLTLNGWYRFTGDAGSQIATSCVPRLHCGAYSPGWMQGNHPSPYEGVVSRTVCYYGNSYWGRYSCCYHSNKILVKNCGDFYVYNLGRTPSCNLRYCGNGTEVKCANNKPCYNGGYCYATNYDYYCNCPRGYTGRNCETNLKVNVLCNHDYMEVELKQYYYPKTNWRNLHLNDPQCRATLHYWGSVIRLRTPLGSCGTNITEQRDMMVFHNNIRIDNSNSSDVITRESTIFLPFHCKYSRRKLVGTSFEAANERVKGSEGSYGNFTFSMNMYKSSNFANKYMPYEYPVKVSLNEKLFIQFQVTSSASKDLVVFAENCRATTSNNPNSSPQYPFLVNGCPKDDTMIYRYQPQSVQRFTINSFRFVHTRKGLVYLHCELLVCHRNSTSSRCARGCVGSRRRRSVDEDDSSSVYSLSTGPILGEQIDSSKAQQNTGSSNGKMQAMSIGLIAMGAILAVVIVAASLVFIRSKRRNISTPAPTVNAYDGPAGIQLDEVEKPNVEA